MHLFWNMTFKDLIALLMLRNYDWSVTFIQSNLEGVTYHRRDVADLTLAGTTMSAGRQLPHARVT